MDAGGLPVDAEALRTAKLKSSSTPENPVVIESRIHLASALAEAAETEHNLMCLYIYATLSLKRSTEEGVTADELTSIEAWRRMIMGISLEEMTHLCLVMNLFAALGATSHFNPPNFPIISGLFPADFVMELAPFDLDAIEHFIFLERPAAYDMKDTEAFLPKNRYERVAPRNRMMPAPGDYKTIGILYGAIRNGLVRLAKELGENTLFCGDPARQVSGVDIPLPGLTEIHDLDSALKAIDTIITQGEGATSVTGSHFERFLTIKTEYLKRLEANPRFTPGRAVARNPVMRKPAELENRVWITHPLSARFLDLANAIYLHSLSVLIQVFAVEERDPDEKHEFLSMAMSFMHVMAALGETLTLLPATEESRDQFAGITFAMSRTLQPLAKLNELDILMESVQIFSSKLKELRSDLASMNISSIAVNFCSERLTVAHSEINDLISRLEALRRARKPRSQTAVEPPRSAEDQPIAKAAERSDVKVTKGTTISVGFDAAKCIHTRHCVTELPQVFKADEPGDWIVPDDSSAEILAAVIHECPSGALTYESRGAFPNEPVPSLNVMRVYENGPYAFMADLEIDGDKTGFRATLCRCGQSKNKPYCDHSHVDAKFIATGEPPTVHNKALKERSGPLKIQRMKDGPLTVSGNLEICAAAGRTVLKTKAVYLCRCGNSKNKPICDGSHVRAGFKDAVPPK
jgi:CDGSH-type Zn-finger protein/uncharacterized Fe-S cluster protein YjdI